ncbi:MAG: hypothetical protein EZS28_002946 [Streblomastix strix]|uniref:Uncharacterized protein n=1 Tax=Streblomastix strix TaxID=222440 RepID=A0A5J4X424_9EUKA|nr:MAG: hypothetical protein EZS28_002946 [Streblomastix strix]
MLGHRPFSLTTNNKSPLFIGIQQDLEIVWIRQKSTNNQVSRTPEEQQHQQQVASAQLLIEQYYDAKVADYDPTGKHPTKYEFEAMEDRIQATLGLKINKKGAVEKASDLDLKFEADVCQLAVDSQRASAAAIASPATNDAESATEWILTSHNLARVLAGKAQQRLEQTLASQLFQGQLRPDVFASDNQPSPQNQQSIQQSKQELIEAKLTLRFTKKNRKPKILRAKERKANDQHTLIQEEVQKEIKMPKYSMDLRKTSVPDRLMARLDQWDKIGGTQTIIRGAQPECISPAAPLFLHSQKQPHLFRGTLELEQEYMNQPERNQAVELSKKWIIYKFITQYSWFQVKTGDFK